MDAFTVVTKDCLDICFANYINYAQAFSFALNDEILKDMNTCHVEVNKLGEVNKSYSIVSIFVLAVFVGFEVVSKVSSTLHTPLMSGANAIHGVILVGAIIVADHSSTNLELGLAVAAIVLATINMVGGFVVTDRMLEMFKGKK